MEMVYFHVVNYVAGKTREVRPRAFRYIRKVLSAESIDDFIVIEVDNSRWK